MGYLDENRCGHRTRNTETGMLWECVRQEHGPEPVKDVLDRTVGTVMRHWYRKVEEDED